MDTVVGGERGGFGEKKIVRVIHGGASLAGGGERGGWWGGAIVLSFDSKF